MKRSNLECHISMENWGDCEFNITPNSIELKANVMYFKFKGSKEVIYQMQEAYIDSEFFSHFMMI